MTFYDYKCTKCNYIERDVKRPITENVGIYECPMCKGEMTQIYSTFRFELKGNGWFKDAYSEPPNIKQKEKISDLHK